MMRHVVLLVATLAATPGLVGAQTPKGSALVLEISGPSTPALRPYAEITGTATISLGGRARLVFVHYLTCRMVTVTGGTVTVEPDRYGVVGGTRSEERTSCPRAVTLKGGGETAGILVRGLPQPAPIPTPGPPPLTLSTEPAFVVIGERATAVTAASIVRAEEKREGEPRPAQPPGARGDEVRLAMTDRRFQWPPGAPPLRADTDYDLIFLFGEPGTPPITVRFTAVPARPTPTIPPPVILSLD